MGGRKIELESVVWIHLAKDRYWCGVPVNMVMNFGSIRGRKLLWWLRMWPSFKDKLSLLKLVVSYLKENTVHFHCRDHLVNVV
jgi:hypothetical protein